jgi:hypothetical protein
MAQVNFAPLPVKAIAEKKSYSFDWSKELNKDGDTITVSAWSIGAGVTINVTDKPATFDIKTTTVWLDPGSTVGEYSLKNTITTTLGRIHVATASLTVIA